jgi:hypothetical protein
MLDFVQTIQPRCLLSRFINAAGGELRMRYAHHPPVEPLVSVADGRTQDHDVCQTFDAMSGLARARELTRALHAVSSMTRIAFPDR